MIMIFVGIITSWIITRIIHNRVEISASYKAMQSILNNIHNEKTIITSRTSYNYSAYIVIKSS